MKSIEERAKEYMEPIYVEGNEIYESELHTTFCDGAKSEREELLKWNNPLDTDGLEDEETVLLKVDCKSIFSNYILGSRCGDQWLTAEGDELPEGTTILGWRNIEEL